jgi:YgiT-type zinc finger domain-containing protein
MKKPKERCDICGKAGVMRRRLPRTYGKGRTLLVVEDVPVMVCPNCGESYLEADTLHAIERIKLLRRSVAKSRTVAVANFG